VRNAGGNRIKERRIQGCAFSELMERLGLFPQAGSGRPYLPFNRPKPEQRTLTGWVKNA